MHEGKHIRIDYLEQVESHQRHHGIIPVTPVNIPVILGGRSGHRSVISRVDGRCLIMYPLVSQIIGIIRHQEVD